MTRKLGVTNFWWFYHWGKRQIIQLNKDRIRAANNSWPVAFLSRSIFSICQVNFSVCWISQCTMSKFINPLFSQRDLLIYQPSPCIYSLILVHLFICPVSVLSISQCLRSQPTLFLAYQTVILSCKNILMPMGSQSALYFYPSPIHSFNVSITPTY